MTGLFFNRGAKDSKKGMGGRLLKEFKGYVKEKQYDKALRCGSEYVSKIGDHNHDLFFTMGAICHMQNRHDRAISYLDKALEIGSYDTEALLLKAKSHVVLGQKRHAVASCRKIQEIDPENDDAQMILDSLEKS